MVKKADNVSEKPLIISVYVGLALVIILSMVPYGYALFLSFVLTILVLAVAYYFAGRAHMGRFIKNHMNYVIRTVWSGIYLSFASVVCCCIYFYIFMSKDSLSECLPAFEAMGMDIYNPEIFKIVFAPCQNDFLRANVKVFMIALVIAILPVLVYWSVRTVRGISRALAGQEIL